MDAVDYLGVRSACYGAVCGCCWRGDYHEFAPGYALVDLYDDESSEIEFFNYGVGGAGMKAIYLNLPTDWIAMNLHGYLTANSLLIIIVP